MSLDVYLTVNEENVYSDNITHNLNKMAIEAGSYEYLWRPDEINITRAKQLIAPLKRCLKRLTNDPERFKQFDAPNGWGKYEHLVMFVINYLDACRKYPKAEVSVSR